MLGSLLLVGMAASMQAGDSSHYGGTSCAEAAISVIHIATIIQCIEPTSCWILPPCTMWPPCLSTTPTIPPLENKASRWAKTTVASPSIGPIDLRSLPAATPRVSDQGAPPPTTLPGATVRETPPYYDAYPVAPRGNLALQPDSGIAYIWNLTDREITVQIDGETKTLSKGKSLGQNVKRQFFWKVENRALESEKIPAGQAAIEIVIRR